MSLLARRRVAFRRPSRTDAWPTHRADRPAEPLGMGAPPPKHSIVGGGWEDVERRAASMGITPGTVLDAQGQPTEWQAAGPVPFIGEIILTPYNFAVQGYAMCDGQLASIAALPGLFSLIGTSFGGDGRATFGFPDFRGRAPIGSGQGPTLNTYYLGQPAGVESVTLSTDQMPTHHHVPYCVSVAGTTDNPQSGLPAGPNQRGGTRFVPSTNIPPNTTIVEMTETTSVGGSAPHTNRSPVLTINFQIAIAGVFPKQS